jgi:hypothetical protein
VVLRRIGVWSVARIAGAMYAVIGLIVGLMIAAFSMIGAGFAAATQNQDFPSWLTTIFGVAAVFLFPILYGGLGLVFGALAAALYNFLSGIVGGVELEVLPAPPTGLVTNEGGR